MTPDDDHAADLNARLSGYDRVMGLRFVSATPDEVRAEMPITPEHHQPYGLVHGGVYAGIVETLCSVGAAIRAMAQGRSAVGLENSTTFLKAAREGTLHARAVPLSGGRRTQVWESQITDDAGRLLAHGKVRLLCLESGASIGGAAVRADSGDLSTAAESDGGET